jgi:prophage regulatory protein
MKTTDLRDLPERPQLRTSKTYDRLIRLHEVKLRTGLGRSSIYRKMADGSFPKPVNIGERAVAWRETDIEHWIATRPTKLRPHSFRPVQ